MFFSQKPTHVSEKESSIGIVGIGIGFTEFMMNSMVATPFEKIIL
jgi:hypothetical protein